MRSEPRLKYSEECVSLEIDNSDGWEKQLFEAYLPSLLACLLPNRFIFWCSFYLLLFSIAF